MKIKWDKQALGNAAFGDTPAERREEQARILAEVAEKIRNGKTSGKLMDYNGNSCGTWDTNAG